MNHILQTLNNDVVLPQLFNVWLFNVWPTKLIMMSENRLISFPGGYECWKSSYFLLFNFVLFQPNTLKALLEN